VSDFDWKSIVRTIAPVLGGAIGGPFGPVASRILSDTLLGKSDGTDAELSDAISNATPEQLAQLKKIDNDFEVQMAELGFKRAELHVRNTESARDMAAKTNYWPQVVLSSVFITGYVIILVGLMGGYITIPVLVKDTILLLLGLLVREIPTIMQFWFGSSSGSKEKTNAMANVNKK